MILTAIPKIVSVYEDKTHKELFNENDVIGLDGTLSSMGDVFLFGG